MIKRLLPIGMLATWLLSGCTSYYFKSTQGTLTNVGLTVPNNNLMQVQIASYLHGDNISIRDKSKVIYRWSTSETNNYFGLIKTMNNRKGSIKVDEDE
jgi:hypothetical protein